MDTVLLVGSFMLFLQVTFQQMIQNEKIIYPGRFYYQHPFMNAYNNQIDRLYYNEGINTPFTTTNEASAAEYKPITTIDNGRQTIFKFPQRPIFLNSGNNEPELKTDITNSQNMVQYLPEITLPNYYQYYDYIPGFYDTLNPKFGFNNNRDNDFIDVQDPNLLWVPDLRYLDPKLMFAGQNIYSRLRSPFRLNKDIPSEDDETYKVIFKGAFSTNQKPSTGNNMNPLKGFKTNFNGDISKCDMICKCRSLNNKPTAPTETESGPNTH